MHIKDHSAAMKFFRTYDSAASKGKWKEFVDEMEFDSMLQEPRNRYAGGQLVQNTADGSRPGYNGRGGPRPNTGGDRSMYIDYEIRIKEPTANQLKIAETAYSKKFNDLKGMDLWKAIGTTKRSNIVQKHITGGTSGVPGGKLKKNMLSKTDFIELVGKNRDKTYNEFVEIIKKYKTKDGQPFTKQIVANRLRDYNLSGSFQKEPPKGSSNIKKAEVEKKRKLHLKETDTTGAKGTRKYNYHHVRQIAGGVPLTTDDVMIINQRINSKLGGETNKALNRISEAIQKNNRLALEAMNAKNEGAALDYMKRVDELNNQAEKIVNSAINKLPEKYKGYVGFNQFTLPTNEYGLPISNEPMIIKKIGGMPVSKDAVDLTTLDLKQEKEFRKIVKAQAEAGKTGAINAKELEKKLIQLGCGMYAGGRVGFKVGSGKCINRAVAKLKSGNLSSAEKKIVDAMGDGLKKGGMPKKFWTTALKGEGYFALADFANNLTKGQSLDKSFSNAIESASLGLIDLGGNERDLMKYAKERGLDTKDMKEWMDYAQTYGKYVEGHKDLKWAEREKEAGLEGFTPSHILNPEWGQTQVDKIEQAQSAIEKAEGQLEEKGKSETIQSGKGYRDMNEMIEGVVAKEWNKPAGVAGLDRGYRKMLGMKGDEGLVWGPIGSAFRESMEKIGFDEHKALKSFTPQTVMNYHPVYGYKEDIKDVIRQGDSPMEDMLGYMEKNYPGSGLIQEALREVAKEKEVEKWVDTGFGREKRKVKTDMGTYDYDPKLDAAEGGIASLNVKK